MFLRIVSGNATSMYHEKKNSLLYIDMNVILNLTKSPSAPQIMNGVVAGMRLENVTRNDLLPVTSKKIWFKIIIS